ncbi:serine/threonine-protein kinase [Stenotrophomonas maltophilia]|uniref:serine/threonine-protein kinase n=1 Tax=Stenotrophomonas maltophilia TaxID=40324 RepID=UPI003BF8EA95
MIGKVFGGRYCIKSLIGSGGMQDVYRAGDTVLGVDVAVKVPQAGQSQKKFRSSAVIAARINHHNVAKTLDYIEDDEGRCLVEELVEGDGLDRQISRFGAVDPHLAARVFLSIAKGLAASHHAGVVHRDLKPSNIIVSSGVNINRLKITDFGIATLAQEVFDEAAEVGNLTRSTSGTIRGALPYMAPEMMFRKPGEHPGRPCDIWSLGALMFQVLSGKVPFGFYLDAAVNVKTNKREPWPGFMVSNIQYADLARQLQHLVEICLIYDPEGRPDADDLVAKIQELCYISVDREEGDITNFIQNGFSGFVDSDSGGTSFFSMESVYGSRRPTAGSNRRICYSSFPGNPKARAHPIVVLD